MRERILSARSEGDSVGGVLETVVYGHPAGIGDPWFDTVEGMLSHILFSIPAIKGVEFGDGFAIAEKMGSEANDGLMYSNGKVEFLSNNSGGINGGISNGEEITLRVAVKPTHSISKKQQTVDLVKGESVEIEIKGRHDACIVPRAVPCIESVVAIAILDEILGD